MSIYNRGLDRNSMSTIARMHAARDRQAAFEADRADEFNVLKRKVRAELVAQTRTMSEAARVHEAENAPVPVPLGLGKALVHPSRARALADFVASKKWSDDPLEPVETMRTLAQIASAMDGDSQERLDRARSALAEYEGRENADETAPAPQPIEIMPPKRGPGRPPRVSLDPSAEDEALPVVR